MSLLIPHDQQPSLTGTLGEVFRISGRGTVLIVENFVGDMPAKAIFHVGDFSSNVTGVDFPRKFIQKEDGSINFDPSMIGLCIEDDTKEQPLEIKGKPLKFLILKITEPL